MSRYKDGRTLTTFRLSDENRRKLFELAELDNKPKSEVIRALIDKSYARRVGK